MAGKISAFGMASGSYALVGRAVLLAHLPEKYYGGSVAKAVTTRGEFLKTYFMAKVEFVASLIGMIFWGLLTLCTLWQNQSCRAHFLAHAGALIMSFTATVVGMLGTIFPDAGKTLGLYMLSLPVIAALASDEIRDYFKELAGQIATYIPQEIRPAQGNLGRLFEHIRQVV